MAIYEKGTSEGLGRALSAMWAATGGKNGEPFTGFNSWSKSSSPSNPAPAGFSQSQWDQLLSLSKNNPSLANLIKQFTGASTTPDPAQAWRRQNPTDTTQLLRQLSTNVGETGMPGGYVGGVQKPAYDFGGQQKPAINNPDMRTYGRTPGYGEATFYQQSMKGGMTPIAALSPMGVPAGWNPAETQKDQIKTELEKYLQGLSGK